MRGVPEKPRNRPIEALSPSQIFSVKFLTWFPSPGGMFSAEIFLRYNNGIGENFDMESGVLIKHRGDHPSTAGFGFGFPRVGRGGRQGQAGDRRRGAGRGAPGAEMGRFRLGN